MADEVKLIDANALKEDFMNDYNNCMMESLRGNHHDVIRISDVIERIENAPTIKAEPVKLRKGVKKFRAKNYVIYDIDYLLENLAREIFMLYQAKSDFDKPLLDVDKIRRMFVDYAPCEKCTNPDTYGEICVKCGACGRKFDDKGVLIDNE